MPRRFRLGPPPDRADVLTQDGHLDSPRGLVGRKNLDTTLEAMQMYPYYGGPMGWGGLAMMTLSMLIFWGGLVTLAVVLLRRFQHTRPANRILEERLAKGEIDTDEFDRLRRTLDAR